MYREDFDKIREAPTGRESEFTFEVLTVRERKIEKEDKKASTRLVADVFSEVAYKIFPLKSQTEINDMFEQANTLRHVDDFDQKILVVAVDLFLKYPNGLNLTKENDPKKLEPEHLQSEMITSTISAIINLSRATEQKVITKIDENKVRTDILTYYTMFFN